MSAGIALLGQPNSGKSTIYNNLTGARQHVGNWAGKTVEKNEGSYTYGGTKFTVTDLPGSYGLSGNSDEEIITTDYIRSGESELTVVLVDASQLERSMFMLAEFARLDKPALLVLNMIDVAKDMGKEIDTAALEKKLGIPVLPFNATDTKDYDRLKRLIADELKDPHKLTVAAPEGGADVKADSKAKFDWVSEIIEGVTKTKDAVYKMSRFDRLMTRPVLGKVVCIGVVLLAFLVAMIIMIPFMSVGQMIPQTLHDPVDKLLTGWNVHPWLVSVFSTMLPNVLFFVISMASFVFGVNVVFGFLEETGFLARAAYQFDGLLSKLGLQGKAICPMLMGLRHKGHGQLGAENACYVNSLGYPLRFDLVDNTRYLGNVLYVVADYACVHRNTSLRCYHDDSRIKGIQPQARPEGDTQRHDNGASPLPQGALEAHLQGGFLQGLGYLQKSPRHSNARFRDLLHSLLQQRREC